MVRLDTKPYSPHYNNSSQGNGLAEDPQLTQYQQILKDLLDTEEPTSSHVVSGGTSSTKAAAAPAMTTSAADAGGGGGIRASMYGIARVSSNGGGGSIVGGNKNFNDETGSISSRRSSNSLRSCDFGDYKPTNTVRITGMENVKEEEDEVSEIDYEVGHGMREASIAAGDTAGTTMLQSKGNDENKVNDDYYAMLFTSYTNNRGDEEEATTTTTDKQKAHQQRQEAPPVLPQMSKIRFGEPAIIGPANTSQHENQCEDDDDKNKTARCMMLRTCWEKTWGEMCYQRRRIPGIFYIWICFAIVAVAIIVAVLMAFAGDDDIDKDNGISSFQNQEGNIYSPATNDTDPGINVTDPGIPDVITPTPAPGSSSEVSPTSVIIPSEQAPTTSPEDQAPVPFSSSTSACFMGDVECEGGCVDIGLFLVTDANPSETSFTLVSVEKSDAIAWSYNTFEESGTEYDYETYICSSSCYQFQLNDEGGDGLANWKSGTPAGYELVYDGLLLSTGMEFGQEYKTFVGDGCSTTDNARTLVPTTKPIDPPTDPPIPIPTVTPPELIPACYETDGLCDATCSTVGLRLTTDFYSGNTIFTTGENSFKLYNVETGAMAWDYGPEGFFAFMTYEFTTNVCSSGCYRFVIEDTAADGIWFGGGFWLSYQNELIATGSDFGASAEAYVGEGCPK